MRGTRVSLTLVRGGSTSREEGQTPPSWEDIRVYLQRICQDLPYRLTLEHVVKGHTTCEFVDPIPMTARPSASYETVAFRIPVADAAAGLEGEIAIIPYFSARAIDNERLKASAVVVREDQARQDSFLLRGGFNIGTVPSLPESLRGRSSAVVRILWHGDESQRYARTNLARSGLADRGAIGTRIEDIWIKYLLENRLLLPEGVLCHLYREGRGRRRRKLGELVWLQNYSALALYELARNGWHCELWDHKQNLDVLADWEAGMRPGKIGHFDFYEEILEIILPRIAAERSLTRYGVIFVGPPVLDWREILASWREFISKPVRWSRCVSYEGEIAKRLHHTWGADRQPFNRVYADRLATFTDDELSKGGQLFQELLRDRNDGRPTELAKQDGALLDRLVDAAGELEIGSVNGVAKLETFRRRK
jgi:hypothetical protein